MTDQPGPGGTTPAPPPPAAPPPAAPPPAAPPPPSTPPPSTQPPTQAQAAWSQAQQHGTEPVPGAPGFYYAGILYRGIAYIIDAIILGLIGIIVLAILAAVFGSIFEFGVGWLVYLVLAVAINAAYFIYTWTAMRGTLGMKILGMQVGNFPDGNTLSMEQAVRRWIALGGPFALAQAFNPIPALSAIISLLLLAYFFFLLYTTYSSPTKQGFHDKFANSVVVAAARVVG